MVILPEVEENIKKKLKNLMRTPRWGSAECGSPAAARLRQAPVTGLRHAEQLVPGPASSLSPVASCAGTHIPTGLPVHPIPDGLLQPPHRRKGPRVPCPPCPEAQPDLHRHSRRHPALLQLPQDRRGAQLRLLGAHRRRRPLPEKIVRKGVS